METGIERLNSIRQQVLSLPAGHKLRIRYRDLRRAYANASEEAEAGAFGAGASRLLDSDGLAKHESEIDRLCTAVNTAWTEKPWPLRKV